MRSLAWTERALQTQLQSESQAIHKDKYDEPYGGKEGDLGLLLHQMQSVASVRRSGKSGRGDEGSRDTA